MEASPNKDQCRAEIKNLHNQRENIPAIVENLVATCNRSDGFDHVGPEPIPSRDAMIGIIHRLQRILFPGYFIQTALDQVNLQYYLGQETVSLFEELSHTEKTHVPTVHPRIFQLKSEQGTDDVEVWLDELRTLASSGDQQAIKQMMNRLVPESAPFATARAG